KVLEGITAWMGVNSEGIHGTRPWKISGNAAPPAKPGEQGFNERNRKNLTAADIRFTSKGRAVYAFLMGWPEDPTPSIPQLALGNAGKIQRVELLGHR